MAASIVAKAKIAIVYYSVSDNLSTHALAGLPCGQMYGHVGKLAQAVAKGATSAGAEVKLFQVAETLPPEVLAKMHAPPKDASVPVLNDPAELDSYDGIIFGSGTRFGMMTAQLKAFFDRTGQVWAKGGWVGKTAGVFFSTAAQGGGQETTALTTITQFTHHGMLYVPIGYSDPALNRNDEIHGGSPYGAGTLAGGDGSRQPSALELGVAEHQGKHHATITAALKRGKAAVPTTQ